MAYQCPECQKILKTRKSLNRHLENQHQKGVPPGPTGSPPGPAGPVVIKVAQKPVKLEIKKPEFKKEPAQADARGYHHIDCGGDLVRGQSPCPRCGKEIDWSQV